MSGAGRMLVAELRPYIIGYGTRPRAVGKARIEGKDYVMHDGEVVEFRFNV